MKNHCERFIDEMLRLAGGGGLLARLRLGSVLILREARSYRQKLPAKHLPVSGFKPELWEGGQRGELYRHLRFHIGCELLGPIGWPLSWMAEQLDLRQMRAGRAESVAELADNAAARVCGKALGRYMHHRASRAEVRGRMMGCLGK